MTDDLVQRLKTERDRFMSFAFAWADLLIETADGRVVFASGASSPLLGCGPEDLIGRPLDGLVVEHDRFLMRELLLLVERHGRINETPVRLHRPNGAASNAFVSGQSLRGGRSSRSFLAFRTNLRFPEAAKGCTRDGDSGLYAGGGLPAMLAGRLKGLAAGGAEASLTLVAVDGLEKACAKLPEADREALLASLGAIVKANAIDGDSAGTVAPGKFGLLSAPGHDMAAMEAEVADLGRAIGLDMPLNVAAANIGIGDLSGIDEADLAKGMLYTLQRFTVTEGTLGLRSLAGSMSALVEKTVGQITAFRSLVLDQRFDVALQPIIDIRTGAIHHFEALCRFHGMGKDTSPYKVINFAEETGLIHQFDLAMAAKVVDWLRRQPRNNGLYSVAVNVSGYSIGRQEYVDGLFELLGANSWLEGRLMFEITESTRMSDLAAANAFIQRLRRAGYPVCLDDFGAGAASFQYLSTLEVDVVKLDGSAVKNAQTAAKGRAFLSALTELCRRLSVETVAEMIDTPEALHFVRECGCDFVQGWLFGKPSTSLGDFTPLPNLALFRRRASMT